MVEKDVNGEMVDTAIFLCDIAFFDKEQEMKDVTIKGMRRLVHEFEQEKQIQEKIDIASCDLISNLQYQVTDFQKMLESNFISTGKARRTTRFHTDCDIVINDPADYES